jgi:hypothetical protein
MASHQARVVYSFWSELNEVRERVTQVVSSKGRSEHSVLKELASRYPELVDIKIEEVFWRS